MTAQRVGVAVHSPAIDQHARACLDELLTFRTSGQFRLTGRRSGRTGLIACPGQCDRLTVPVRPEAAEQKRKLADEARVPPRATGPQPPLTADQTCTETAAASELNGCTAHAGATDQSLTCRIRLSGTLPAGIGRSL